MLILFANDYTYKICENIAELKYLQLKLDFLFG